MKTCLRKWVVAMTLMVGALSVEASVISKDNNTDALNLGSSWVGGVAPGPGDVATWDAALTASKTYSLGADLSWLGLAFSADPGGNVTVNPGYTLTLGSAGIYVVPNRTVTLNSGMVLSADQPWYVGVATFVQAGAMNMGGYTLTLSGNATKQFKGLITGGGRMVNNGSGGIKFTNAGTAAPTTDVELSAANLTFETATGLATGPRTKSLVMSNGATVSVGGRSDRDTVETNANALTVGPGSSSSSPYLSAVTVTPLAAKNAGFYSGSLVRNPGSGLILFRGTGLGTNSLASLTPNSANVVFGSAPAMLGAGGVYDSTTNSIVPGVLVDTTTSGLGMGLVTYDDAYGLRLLKFDTEYTASIVDGQMQLDNVRLTNSVNVVLTNTLATATAVNSLSCVADAAAETQHGIRIDGAGTLTVNSGVIYASVNATSVSTANSVVFDVPALNLNGHEGVFISRAMGAEGGGSHGGATLEFACAITNDGGKGVTVSGSVIKFSGTSTNTYTGPTRCNYGFLWLAKSGSPLPGDLVVNGGSVQNTGGQIADNRDLYINGGTYNQKGGDWNSGSGAWETFRNLYMTGGTYGDGAAGTSSGNTYLTNALLTGGLWAITSGHSTHVGGTLTLAGGVISIRRANDTSRNTTMTLEGAITITNTESDAYTPLSLDGGTATGVNGGRLVLSNDLAFVGNALNTNATLIGEGSPSSGGGWGTVFLHGTHVFDIGNGAANVDLIVAPTLANHGAVAGGLTKSGFGTLDLTGTNSYTGATTVEAGVLALDGYGVSPVTVQNGAVLTGAGLIDTNGVTALTVEAGGIVDPGGVAAVGALTVTGDVSFAASSVYRVDVGAGGADLLAVSGAVSGGPVTVNVAGAVTAPVLIMSATSGISASFTTATSGWVVGKRADGTELWLVKNQGTLIRVQ